jgi:tetratricopeptide (TPR) repeat protein
MSARRRVWVHFGMLAVTAAFVAAAWTFRPEPMTLPAEFLAARKPVSAEYVEDARCASCHSEIADRFARSGMGRAFNTWKDAEPVEDRTEGPGPVLTLGDLHYQVVIDRGRMFQREFRIVDGKEVELNRREAVYVLGSGTKGRGYLASQNGYLVAMPISWYTGRDAWDFSPGYREHNARFGRPIRGECMDCHNAQVGVLVGASNGYIEPLPTGIGCQRCHGPGAAHVDFQERGDDGLDPMPKIKTLDPRRQIDVCLQCHLLSDDAVRRDGCEWTRPGDRLADCRADYFVVPKAAAFDAVGHGPRSMASKCYTASGGKMTCTVCHDPHAPARGVPRDAYNRRCDECHQQVQCKRPLPASESPRRGDCVSCHMPSKRADDIPHTSSTEHWIHVPGRKLGAPFPPPKTPAAPIAAWTAGTSPVADAIAALRHSINHRPREDVKSATATLVALLERSKAAEGSPWLDAARGYMYQGDLPNVKDAVGRTLAVDPKNLIALELYAFTLGQSGDFNGQAAALETALREHPWYNLGDAALLDALSRSRGEQRAFELYERYLRFHPPTVESLLLLGDMKRRVKAPSREAVAFYEKAKAADGARPEPHLALARLAMAEQSYLAAARHAKAASDRSPGDAAAPALESACLAMAGDRAAAKQAAERALALDPSNADARRVLHELETSERRKR